MYFRSASNLCACISVSSSIVASELRSVEIGVVLVHITLFPRYPVQLQQEGY